MAVNMNPNILILGTVHLSGMSGCLWRREWEKEGLNSLLNKTVPCKKGEGSLLCLKWSIYATNPSLFESPQFAPDSPSLCFKIGLLVCALFQLDPRFITAF
ncbi:hypothetical protein ES332_A11G351600v1 [Gossypium tomentosum]|uniref:Uncharacterized protein n=1 Tax=Gossypium tomentosum TaxID=34277 RepID=A0A5D2NHK3_GOSTO|nr:hypothetical protein ES332_A11G351600v1 [Gossypium tomentosum]